jgi:tRNA threonylcarbamoyladenosine biosynthesis protein TsaE
MAKFISHSPEDTAALGESWGRQAQPGWLIGLIGDLGAGKTLLAAGIARGLGVTDRVHSPTFALVN